MSFLERVLEPPSYGYTKNGVFMAPSLKALFAEFFRSTNIFRDRRNWLSLLSWGLSVSLGIPLFTFLFLHFSWPLLGAAFLYSMVFMGTHGTIYLHRYATHHAFKIKSPFWLHIVKNLVIKIIPDEIYVISHHVHHSFSEQPGDPYNVNGGWFYCFFADAIHQPIRRDLTEAEYGRVVALIQPTGIKPNSYVQYQRWGSLCHPFRTVVNYATNWGFWFGAFYLIGGIGLATALFGSAAIWAFGVRTFNYDGHGRGIDKRRDGIDFNRADISINQVWPGYVASEWHNNHHLYPNGARSGFQDYQLDLAWKFIKVLEKVGIATSVRDFKEEFLEKHLRPYLLAHPKGEPKLSQT